MTTHHGNYGRFAIVSSSAHMPRTVKAQYRNVAIVKTETPGQVPAMISDHARGVVEIVTTWPRCNVGKTERAAFQSALREADAMAQQLFYRG